MQFRPNRICPYEALAKIQVSSVSITSRNDTLDVGDSIVLKEDNMWKSKHWLSNIIKAVAIRENAKHSVVKKAHPFFNISTKEVGNFVLGEEGKRII